MQLWKEDGANELERFAGILHLLHRVVNGINTPAVSGAVTRNGQSDNRGWAEQRGLVSRAANRVVCCLVCAYAPWLGSHSDDNRMWMDPDDGTARLVKVVVEPGHETFCRRHCVSVYCT